MNPFQVSTLITAGASLVLSVVVFSAGKNQRVNQVWALTTFLLGLWSISLFGVISSNSQQVALIWQYILDASAIIIPIGFFIFVLYLLNLQEKYSNTMLLSWVIGTIVLALSFTKYFKLGVAPKLSFNYWIVPGPLYIIFPLFFVLFVCFALYLLLKERRATKDPVLRTQIDLVLGAQIFGFGGGITNFLPQIFNIYPFGNYFIVAYIFFISYSILKHGLFNLKVIATELLIYGIWIFLAARTLLGQTLSDRIIDGALLIAMVVFGILLINSVRREVEQRIKLEALTKELEAANEKLKDLDKLKSQFLSFASHQVKAPMNVVKGYATLIYDGTYGPASDKIKDTAIKIKESADRMIALVNNIMDLRKIEEGVMEYKFEEANIGDMVADVVGEFRMLAENKKLQLEFTKPEKILMANVDIQKVRQSIQNLVENAIKYTDTGWIKVEVNEFQYNNVLVTVTDTGHGIAPELLPKLFEQYQRDSATASKIEGTGLGLFIAKEIVTANHGEIWAESGGTGKGSKFCIKLPRSL
jgi:signal transduction histidine kinase